MSKTTTNINKMTTDELQALVEKYLPVRESEKNKFGEVFTPTELIREMLGKLPTSVWRDPTLKWLDPANGIGNFPMVAFEMLNNGLSKVAGFKDEGKRKKHIIEKMLYMVELNPKNVAMSRKIFGLNANIYCGSFLEDGWKKAFGVEKFDVIMGNPPFNASQEYETKKGGGDSLWDKFVIDSIKLLGDKRYLVFVHPSAWRKPESEKSKSKGLFTLMAKENQLHYLDINDAVKGKEVFNASTRYDWYALQKTPNTQPTTVKDQHNIITKLNLLEFDFLPNHSYGLIKKILGKSDIVIFSASQFETRKNWVNKEKTEKFKYPLIHSTTKTEGVKYFYTSTKTPDVKKFIPMFGSSKVIFGETGIYNSILDLNGIYGMTQQSMALKINNKTHGENIKKAIESDKFKTIIDACSWSNYRIDWRMFNYFKPDFYKYFLDKPSAPTRKRAKSLPSKSLIKRKTIKHSAGGRRLKTKRIRKNRKSTRKNAV